MLHSSPQRVPPKLEAGSGSAPRIVAMGGGTGLPNVLRGLRGLMFPDGATDLSRDRLVAIVATSDDGGSSGRLRAEFNMIPPATSATAWRRCRPTPRSPTSFNTALARAKGSTATPSATC
jgi:hypothetical protein